MCIKINCDENCDENNEFVVHMDFSEHLKEKPKFETQALEINISTISWMRSCIIDDLLRL